MSEAKEATYNCVAEKANYPRENLTDNMVLKGMPLQMSGLQLQELCRCVNHWLDSQEGAGDVDCDEIKRDGVTVGKVVELVEGELP